MAWRAALSAVRWLWDQRQQRIMQRLGPGRYVEICAESWPWQANASPEELWAEMFKCWSQSPGHWSVASRLHQSYGAGVALGRNRVHYATIITKD